MAREDTTRRYRERNREAIRVKARAYSAARRRSLGMPALGTPESTENRTRARKLAGPEHPNWKGADATYTAHHHWIGRWGVRIGVCSQCGAEPKPKSGFRNVGTEWANLSGEYRRDLADYIELCVPCHRALDSTGGDF